MFYKYQHVANNFNSPETKGLLRGDVIIQPKLDGSNCQIYMEDDKLVVTSRQRILSYNNDNQECYRYIMLDQDKYLRFFAKNRGYKIVGEWLVQHKIQYHKDAYKQFYAFDVITYEDENGFIYMNYIDATYLLNEYDIRCVPYIQLSNPELLSISNLFADNEFYPYLNFLLPSADKFIGEGVVVKNYNYTNQFGRSTWCKLINEDVYKSVKIKPKKPEIDKSKEIEFINKYLTTHLLEKCYHRISEEKNIGDFVKECQAEFIDDFYTPEYNVKYIRSHIAKIAVDFIKKKFTNTEVE